MSNEYKEWREDYEWELNDFVEKYCNYCNSQECAGPHTELSEDCPQYIKYFEEPYETANNRAKRS